MMTLYMYWLKVKGMITDKKGQGMVEYVLIIALVGILLVASLTGLSTGIGNKFSEVITKMNPTTTSTP